MSRTGSSPPIAGSRGISVMIPGCWYAVAPSTALDGRRPLGLERLGQRFVAWRDGQGRPAILPAACPHRGFDLSQGRVRDGEIECPYHGFRFTGAGTCTAMPCEGADAKIPGRLRAEPPVVREAHGLVWMWHGPPKASLPELPWLDGAPRAGPRTASLQVQWPVSFTRVIEGMQEVHHVPFGHRKIEPFGRRRVDPVESRVERGADGVDRIHNRLTIRHEHESPEEGLTFHIDNAFPGVVRLGTGNRVTWTAVLCPIDEQRTWIWACYSIRTGLGGLADRLASWLGLKFEFGLVQPDDRRLTARARPQGCDVDDHVLIGADAPIGAWHGLRRQRIAAANDAEEPESEG